MRIYCETQRPTQKLVRLSTIIVNFYAPVFFQIKQNSHISDGAKNFFFALKCARETLNAKERKITDEVFLNNCFMAHPESILLAAVKDPNLDIRKMAIEFIRIDRIRRSEGKVRQFVKPTKLNFNAQSYFEMIDFKSLDPSYITEPPLLFDYEPKDFKECSQGRILYIPVIHKIWSAQCKILHLYPKQSLDMRIVMLDS